MSKTSIIGALGVALQSAKGTPGTSFSYFPAESLDINAQQNVQQLPPEIAGNYFPRLAYKAGVSVGGNASVNVRADSVGHLFYMLTGQTTDSAVSGQAGAYQHVMAPFTPSATADLPWYTIIKDVAKLYAEQFVDVRLSSLQLDVPKAGVATASTSFFGITPSEVTVPSGETFDSGPIFQTCQATLDLQNEATGTTISANSIIPDRVQLTFNNQLSQDEQVVGSYYPADVTLLQRSVAMSYDITLRDPSLVRAVYRNGGTSAWSPQVYRGSLHLTLISSTNIPTTTQPYQVKIDIPGLDFMMMPISLQGAQLIRANLTAQVSLGTSGNDQFTVTIINGTATY